MAAQIKFTQGLTNPPGGQALAGVVAALVVASHTGGGVITSYTWEMLATPPGSIVPTGVMSLVSTASFTPDVVGGYLIRLTTVDNLSVVTSDERAVLIPDTTYGRVIPPFDAPGNSLNVGGQARGWSPFMEAYLGVIDRLGNVGGAAPSNGQGLIWNTANNRYEPGSSGGISQLTGDVTAGPGTGSQAATVVKVNGATVPAAGALTTGNVLQVSAAAALVYAALNLAGGPSYVTGLLPTTNQAAQALGGDLTGTTASAQIAAGAIVNTDVNNSAAIAGTKIAPDFGAQVVKTTGRIEIGAAPVASVGSIRVPTPPAGLYNTLDVLATRNVNNTTDYAIVRTWETNASGTAIQIGDVNATYTTIVGSTASISTGITGGGPSGAYVLVRPDGLVGINAGTNNVVELSNDLVTDYAMQFVLVYNGVSKLMWGPSVTQSLITMRDGATERNALSGAANVLEMGDVAWSQVRVTGANPRLGTASSGGQFIGFANSNGRGTVQVDPTEGLCITDNAVSGFGLRIKPVYNGTTVIQFEDTVTAAAIKQSDKTTNGGTGAPLTIQAQNETGTTSTGGALVLQSGTGTAAPGDVLIKSGATTIGTLRVAGIDFTASGGNVTFDAGAASILSSVTYTMLNSGIVYLASSLNGRIRFDLSATANSMKGVDTITSLTIGFDDKITNSGTGAPLTLSAQNETGTTSTGGALILAAGTGTSTHGEIVFKRGSTQIGRIVTLHGFASFGGAGSDYVAKIGPMPGFETGNAGAWFLASEATAATSSNVNIYGNGSQTIINVPSTGTYVGFLDAGATYFGQWSLSELKIMAGGLVTFGASIAAPIISQADLATNGGTGATTTIRAQNETGTTSTGGSLVLQAGSGTTTAGNVSVQGAAILFGDQTGTERARFITVAGTTLQFAAADTSVTINQAQATSGNGKVLKIQAQAGFGTGNTSGGQLQLYSGAPNGTGAPGLITVQAGGSSSNATIWVDKTSVEIGGAGANVTDIFIEAPTISMRDNANNAIVRMLHSGGLTSPSWAVAANVTGFSFKQADLTTNSGTGATFTIQAQNETGTTSTGGSLILQAGSGTTVAGNVSLLGANVLIADQAGTERARFVTAAGTILQFAAADTSVSIAQAQNTSTSGVSFAIRAQDGFGTGNTNGGSLSLSSGAKNGTGLPGAVALRIDTAVMVETVQVIAGNNVVSLAKKSGLTSTEMPANTGDGVVYLANAATLPTTGVPVSGVLLYADAGAFKGIGTSGTVTTIAAAHPHCPTCGRDFALEWRNTRTKEHMAVCMPCQKKALEAAGVSTEYVFVWKEAA